MSRRLEAGALVRHLEAHLRVRKAATGPAGLLRALQMEQTHLHLCKAGALHV